MSVIVARAALGRAQEAVDETRRLVPDSPLARAALAAAWDARCALRRAIDAACRGDQAEVATAGSAAMAAASRATEIASRAVAWTGGSPEGFPTDGVISGTGIAPAPGSSPDAPRSLGA